MSAFNFTETALNERLELHLIYPSCKQRVIFSCDKPSLDAEKYIEKLEKEIKHLRTRLYLMETHPYIRP